MDWLIKGLGSVEVNSCDEAVRVNVRDQKPSTFWSNVYKSGFTSFIVDVRVQEGREDEACLVVCGTALNERQVRTILPIPSFLMFYTPPYLLHGEIKCLSMDFRVLEPIMIDEKSKASFWTHHRGVVTIDWAKVLPEVYTLPSSFKTLDLPFIKGVTLEANFPLNAASFNAFLDGYKYQWDAVGPIDMLKTSADIIYYVGDDDGPIEEVFLQTHVHSIGCFQPFNSLVSLPAIQPIVQRWDIILGKRPKGKLRVYGLILRDEEDRTRLLSPKEPLYWGNTWYTPEGYSQPSKAQYQCYYGMVSKGEDGEWVKEKKISKDKMKITKLDSLTTMDVYLCEPFPSKSLADTHCDADDDYRDMV